MIRFPGCVVTCILSRQALGVLWYYYYRYYYNYFKTVALQLSDFQAAVSTYLILVTIINLSVYKHGILKYTNIINANRLVNTC